MGPVGDEDDGETSLDEADAPGDEGQGRDDLGTPKASRTPLQGIGGVDRAEAADEYQRSRRTRARWRWSHEYHEAVLMAGSRASAPGSTRYAPRGHSADGR